MQRLRLIHGAALAVEELGASDVAVVDIVSRAGVSRNTFYELFADREDCLVAAFEHALAGAWREALPAWRMDAGWAQRVRGALAGILAYLDREATLGSLLLGEASGALAASRAHVLRLLATAVDEARVQSNASAGVTELTAEGIVGAVLGIVRSRHMASPREPLAGLLGELMAIVVLPYLGSRAAARELQRTQGHVSAVPGPMTQRELNPFEGLGIRVTYRTVRVLTAIAELTSADQAPSSTQVARHAEVTDLGQMSKLLARLARAGLVENTALGISKGEAYAWRLTSRGQQVHTAIGGDTAVR